MKNLTKIIFAVFFGLLITVLFLEGGLRLGALLVERRSGALNDSGHENRDKFRIVCLGDSFTYGLGAPRTKSYPDFLAKYLRKKTDSFEVINCGHPGLNTAMLSLRLEDIIKAYRPDMLIIMTGANDSWNTTGLFDQNKDGGGAAAFLMRNSKLFKLLKICLLNINREFNKNFFRLPSVPKNIKNIRQVRGLSKEQEMKVFSFAVLFNRANYFRVNKDYGKSLELVYYLRQLGVKNTLTYALLDNLFIEMNDFSRSIDFCLALNNEFPGDTQLLLRLARLYKAVQDQERARDYFQKVLELDPQDKEARQGVKGADFFIERSLTAKFDLKEASNVLPQKSFAESFAADLESSPALLEWKGVEKFRFEDGDFALLLSVLPDWGEGDLVRFNKIKVEKICDTLRKHKVTAFFLGYPMQVYDYVEETAKKRGFPFVDLRPRFAEIISLENRDKYFIPDGHCTALGYEVIGKAVADVILRRFPGGGKKQVDN